MDTTTAFSLTQNDRMIAAEALRELVAMKQPTRPPLHLTEQERNLWRALRGAEGAALLDLAHRLEWGE